MTPMVHVRYFVLLSGAAILLLGTLSAEARAAPEVQNLSPRGLQAGATTTLTIDGADLLPEPRLLSALPIVSQTVKPGGSAGRVQIDVTLGNEVAPGTYQLRLANAKGVSAAVAVGVDVLPQTAFAPQTARLPAALHGAVAGDATARTTFTGKRGQRVVVEVEARRLGAAIDPLLELHDARRVQVAWAQGTDHLAGDARLEATLPADGEYAVELRDALYRAGNPNHFRLKIGDLRYADLLLPLALQRGGKGSVQLLGNVAADTRVSIDLTNAAGDSSVPLPRVPGLSSPAPALLVSDVPEIVESEQPAGKLQDVTVPAGINGRIGTAKEEDRYRLLVQPGASLRFDVLANRAGSSLDGVLTLRNEAGAVLASNDDRANTIDPGFDFTVPQGVTALVLALTDLHGHGGPHFVYRIAVTPAGRPDFSLSLAEDRHHVPRGGSAVVRVRAARAGYNGPIKLSLPGLPEGVVLSGHEVPAGVSETLLSLSASSEQGLAQLLTKVVGDSADPKVPLRRVALLPETPANRLVPWLRSERALAVTEPAPIAIAWDTDEAGLTIGRTYPAKVKLTRAAGANGPVLLSLLTNQVVPNAPPQPGQPPRPDLNRALRFQGAPTVPANQAELQPAVLVPADLPALPYDLVIKADLLSADGKKVLATAVTPSRRLPASRPQLPPALVVFEDQDDFVKNLTQGNGKAALDMEDKHSGKSSIKITPDQRFNPSLPGLGVLIRKDPGMGEYRYLRFAWKKKGGQAICLQLSHGGLFGPQPNKPAKFRYHAGPGPECFGASLAVAEKLPEEWVVVTRDLYADFGEFSLTGLALSAIDGEYALFDHIILGRTMADLDKAKP